MSSHISHKTSNLNTSQQLAVNHRGSNLLIIAGAGSGKTSTLTQRAISLLKEIKPHELMVVTFTKKAAAELNERIRDGYDGNSRDLKQAWIGTIHSICYRILLEQSSHLGLPGKWTVLDASDTHSVMAQAGKAYNLDQDKSRSVADMYSYARNSLRSLPEILKHGQFQSSGMTIDTLQKVVTSYQRRCKRSSRIDLDDLQVRVLELFKNKPYVLDYYRKRFRAILIDEYQDTNRIQAAIFKLLATDQNITVVGDDAQSIYGFRAATVENILNFEQEFGASKIILDINYRSTPGIVNLTNEIIRHNTRQIPKSIQAARSGTDLPSIYFADDPTKEAEYIFNHILKTLDEGKELKDIAVLFRATRLAAPLQILLNQFKVPYILVGGEDFFSLPHVKAILNVVRLMINPDDSIALGSLQPIVGFSNAQNIEKGEQQSESGQCSFWDTEVVRSDRSLQDFQKRITFFSSQTMEDSISPLISQIIQYISTFFKSSNKYDEITQDFSILATIAGSYTSIEDFINTLSLTQFVDEEQFETPPLVLSTIHGAKGLEWHTVFVISLVEFWMPLNLAIQQTGTDEEERRLFYVAATRAREHLHLTTYRKSTNQFGREFNNQTSRFIQEIRQVPYTTGQDLQQYRNRGHEIIVNIRKKGKT